MVLGTGGTIAGLAASTGDNVGYASAQVAVETLLGQAGLAGESPWDIESEQVTQIDSKDMGSLVWQQLAVRCRHNLARPDVDGLVVTHGTDTTEETAYFLHRVLGQSGAASKPVVLTGAMRPGSSLAADGPQNLHDALTVACDAKAHGVTVVFASCVYAAAEVQKVHTYSTDAFSAGDNGPLGWVIGGTVRWLRMTSCDTAEPGDHGVLEDIVVAGGTLPRVEIVTSHAGADGFVVDALLEAALKFGMPLRGIVVAGTGNGTLHCELEQALLRARDAGVTVLRTSRCASGPVLARDDDRFAAASGLSPAKARVALMLQLLGAARAPAR
ncbi:MAG: asparaginase [Burkholderiaceae bacterium]